MEPQTTRTRRRRAVLATLGATSVLTLLAVLLWPASLEKRVSRIHSGMTQAEVEAVMGSPPGRYRTDDGYSTLKHPIEGALEWDLNEGFVVVQFDSAGTAKDATLYPTQYERSLVRRFLDRLGW